MWQRNSQDEGFSYKAGKEDVSFYLPHKAFADCESGQGDALSLTQHIHFKMLEEQGLAERFANGFALELETVVNLESDPRVLFGLPDSWPGSFELMTQGSSFQRSFGLRLRLRTACGDTVPYRLEGPFLRLSEIEHYLPSPAQWSALKTVAAHQALPDEARSEYRNLLAVHHIQKAAEAGCDIDLRQFADLKTREPERISVSLERLPDGGLELTPNFEGLVSPEQVARRLGQIAPDNDTIQSLRVGDTIILLDEKRLKATQELIKNRSIPAKYARQFLTLPTAFLDATLVDLDVGYSARVQGIAEFRHAYFGEPEASGIDWFDRVATDTHQTTPGPESLGRVIQDSTDLAEFRERLQDAIKTGAAQVVFREQLISIADRESIERALDELEREFQAQSVTEDSAQESVQTDPSGEAKGSQTKLVVDVRLNDELLDIKSRYENSLPDKHLYRGELSRSGYKRQPFPYQEEGIRWLIGLSQRALERPDEESLLGSLLADDMGLGKTLMVLVALGEYYRFCVARGVTQKPTLVVAPLSLLDTWKTEVEQTFVTSPFVDIVTLHGDAGLARYRLPGRGIEIRERDNPSVLENGETSQQVLLSLKVGERFGINRLDTPSRLVITNYDTLANYQFSLCQVDWSFVVFDEAQSIKNPNTIQTRAAKGVKAQFKLMVTGTPVENQLRDFWCLFDTAVPGLLDSYQAFRQTYVRPLLRVGAALPEVRQEVGKQIRENVGALMLRRIKEDHLEGLPDKKIYVGIKNAPGNYIYLASMDCRMSDSQRDIYNAVIEGTIRGMTEGNEPGLFLAGLQRLRDVSLHPGLLGGAALPLPATVQECRAEIRKSGKLAALLCLLDEVQERGEKILIFVINKQLQAFLSHALGKIYALPVSVINGDTKAVAKRKSDVTRRRLIQQFEAREGFGMMVMSPIAAGVGLTITGANNVIHLERHWNPAKEDQATDRVYRIGQSKDVRVFIPILHHPEHDSFDLHLHRLLAKKIDLKDAVVVPERVTYEAFQQTDILGRTTGQDIPSPLSEQDLDLMGWEQFEALVAELLCRMFDGDAQLTPMSNDKGCDMIFVSTHGNLLAQCKHTKYRVLQGDSFVREIYASQKFYANRLAKSFEKLAVFTNARKISKQGRRTAESHRVQLHDRSWILENLRQYPITKFDLLRRIDKPRLTW